MTEIRFVLECALVALVVGSVMSVAVSAVHRLVDPWLSRCAPSRRSDLLLIGALLPGAAAVAVTLAAAGPSIVAMFHLDGDHCVTHAHHAHLCLVHAFDVSMLRTALSAAALALLAFRTIHLLMDVVSRRRAVHALEALGSRSTVDRFPVIRVPGGPNFCHAVGLLRRRVVLSDSLAKSISKAQLRAALAHENAHHERFDGLATFLVRLSEVFFVPSLMNAVMREHRAAMEEAADAAAAHVVGDSNLVADAVVTIARIQIARPGLQNGMTGAAVERRVLRLLATADDQRSPGIPGVAILIGLLTVVVIIGADAVHHTVETLLHLL